jgi:hypothetical protein
MNPIIRKADKEHWPNQLPSTGANYLQIRSKLTFQSLLGFEYSFSKNFNASIGGIFGIDRTDYMWKFRFIDYHPNIDFGSFVDTYHVKRNIPYAGINVAVGYNMKPSKTSKITLQSKLGLNYVKYLKNSDESVLHRVNYIYNDTMFNAIHAFTEAVGYSIATHYNVYIGAAYPIESSFFKEARLGITFTGALGSNGHNDVGVAHALYYDNTGEIVGADLYFNKFRNLGITLGFTF